MVVYVNWDKRELLTEEEYDEKIDKFIEDHDNETYLKDWLDDDFTPSELYELMLNENENTVHELFIEALENMAIEGLESEGYTIHSIEEG